MPDHARYIVLLNDALKGALLRLDGKGRARMREKFEFLENGFWDAGVRVKKLRGTSGKVVFEARMSRGDRLLFTLGSHGGRTAIYVWGLVSHDDISRGASRIVPANAPFLDFIPAEEEERADLALESAPPQWHSQEDVEQKAPEDYGPQKWLVLDEEEWQRMLSSPDPGRFECYLLLTREQEHLLSVPPPVLLSGTAGSGKTTLSVYYLLRGAAEGSHRLFLTYNPLLRAFAERMYDGLVEKRRLPAAVPRPRFAVLRDLLREIADPSGIEFPPDREAGLPEFAQIFSDHRHRRAYDPELVWEEIRSIVKGAKLPLNPARLSTLASKHARGQPSTAERGELCETLLGLENLSPGARAASFLRARTSLEGWAGFVRGLESVDPAVRGESEAVLGEVLRQVARASEDFSSPLLSLEEYLALGRKRAPVFLGDRREIHAIAEFYQERLARAGRWDELDLTRAALRRMEGGGGEFSWDLVVCDEVQDLTDLQLALLFRLARSPRDVVLTGDPRQIINPSGFRWEEVKNKLYERGLPVPPVHRLSLNFRCVGSIVELANALLDIKAALIGVSDTDSREQWKFSGRPPLLLSGIPEAGVLARIDARAAGQAVLTRTAAERERLKEALGTDLVFTIGEAKGLEFDTVFLWRFCDEPASQPLWKAVAEGRPLEPARIPHLRHELALLYVGVTRARTTLIFYDGEKPSPVWDIPSLAMHVFQSREEARLAELWGKVSAPAEWDSQAEYYLAHGHWAAARECFRNAGNELRQGLAEAFLLSSKGEHAEAAPLFEAAGEMRQAAESRERAGQWGPARKLWRALGEPARERPAAARMHEQAGNWGKAAREWEAAGEPSRALDCWEKGQAWERAGRAAEALREFARAARLLDKAKLPREAAACLEKAGRAHEAADMFFKAGAFAEAARLYAGVGASQMLERCYRELGDEHALAAHFEADGRPREAREEYARFAGRSPGNRARLLAEAAGAAGAAGKGGALAAGLRYSALGLPEKAGRLLLKAGAVDLAAEDFERTGSWDDLSLCREHLGQHLAAARALEKAGLEDRDLAAKLHGLLHAHLAAAGQGAEEAAREMYEEAVALREEGKAVPALVRFRLLQDSEAAVELARGLGWHDEAVRLRLESEKTGAALELAGADGAFFPAGSLATMIDEFSRRPVAGAGSSPAGGQAAHRELLEVFTAMLGRLPRGTPAEEAAAACLRLVTAARELGISAESLPQRLLDLLLERRAAAAVRLVLEAGIPRRGEPPEAVRAFAEQAARRARATGDAELASACAWAVERISKVRSVPGRGAGE